MRLFCPSPYRPLILILTAAFASAGIAGCARVRTYPVKGKVVLKDGRPLTGGGRIEFQSTSDTQVKATGWIDMIDGSFSLTTIKDGQQIGGAIEGPHRVVVELRNPARVIALAIYTVEPRPNEFTIEVPKAGGK